MPGPTMAATGPFSGFISVSTGPGCTVVTVIPRGPRSRTRPRVKPVTAPFVSVYADAPARVILNDPEAICRCAIMGLGIAMIATTHLLPHLKSRALVRLLSEWHADVGPISIYFAGQKLLPAKTRVFVDFVVESFKRQGLAAKFSAS